MLGLLVRVLIILLTLGVLFFVGFLIQWLVDKFLPMD
jgi:hypothetical protein